MVQQLHAGLHTRRGRRLIGTLAAAVVVASVLPATSQAVVDTAVPAARVQGPKTPMREHLTGWAGIAKGAPVAEGSIHVLDMAGRDITAEVTGLAHPSKCTGVDHLLCTHESGVFSVELIEKQLPAHYVLEVRGGTILGKPTRGALVADIIDDPERLHADITLGTTVAAALVAKGKSRAQATMSAKTALGLPEGADLASTLKMTDSYIDATRTAAGVAAAGGLDKAVRRIAAQAAVNKRSALVIAPVPTGKQGRSLEGRSGLGELVEGVAEQGLGMGVGKFFAGALFDKGLDIGIEKLFGVFGYKSETSQALDKIQDTLKEMQNTLNEMNDKLDDIETAVGRVAVTADTTLAEATCTAAITANPTAADLAAVQKMGLRAGAVISQMKNVMTLAAAGPLSALDMARLQQNLKDYYSSARGMYNNPDHMNDNTEYQSIVFGSNGDGLLFNLQKNWQTCAKAGGLSGAGIRSVPMSGNSDGVTMLVGGTADAVPSWVRLALQIAAINEQMAIAQSYYLASGITGDSGDVTIQNGAIHVDLTGAVFDPTDPQTAMYMLYATNYLSDVLLSAAIPSTSKVPDGDVYIFDAAREAAGTAVTFHQVPSNSPQAVTPKNAVAPTATTYGLADWTTAWDLLVPLQRFANGTQVDIWLTQSLGAKFPVNSMNAPLNVMQDPLHPGNYNLSRNVWAGCGDASGKTASCYLMPNLVDHQTATWPEGYNIYAQWGNQFQTTLNYPVHGGIYDMDEDRINLGEWAVPFVGFMTMEAAGIAANAGSVNAYPFAGNIQQVADKNWDQAGHPTALRDRVGLGNGHLNTSGDDLDYRALGAVPTGRRLLATGVSTPYTFWTGGQAEKTHGGYCEKDEWGWDVCSHGSYAYNDAVWFATKPEIKNSGSSVLVTGDNLSIPVLDGGLAYAGVSSIDWNTRSPWYDTTLWRVHYNTRGRIEPDWHWRGWWEAASYAYTVNPLPGGYWALPNEATVPVNTNVVRTVGRLATLPATITIPSSGGKFTGCANETLSECAKLVIQSNDPDYAYTRSAFSFPGGPADGMWGLAVYYSADGSAIDPGFTTPEIAQCVKRLIEAGQGAAVMAYCGTAMWSDPKFQPTWWQQYPNLALLASCIRWNIASDPIASCLVYTAREGGVISRGTTLQSISECAMQMLNAGHGAEASGYCSWPPTDTTGPFTSFGDKWAQEWGLYTCIERGRKAGDDDPISTCISGRRTQSTVGAVSMSDPTPEPSPTASPSASPTPTGTPTPTASPSPSASSGTAGGRVSACGLYNALLNWVSSASIADEIGARTAGKLATACGAIPMPAEDVVSGVDRCTLYSGVNDLLSSNAIGNMRAGLGSAAWDAMATDCNGRSGALPRALMLPDASMAVITPVVQARRAEAVRV